MSQDDFVDLVERMRGYQVAFFKNRKHSDLEEAKKHEKAVDNAVREYKDKQIKLDY